MPLMEISNDLAFDLFARYEDERAEGACVSRRRSAPTTGGLADVQEIARRLSSVVALFPAGQPAAGLTTGRYRSPPSTRRGGR